MIKQYVVFGEYAVNAASEGNFTRVKRICEDSPNSIGYRTFKSEEERQAYLCGLEDATGWMESMPLSDDDVKKLSKRMRLSDIEDLADKW